ncbi:hypothetical protein BQ8420_24630 [Nocardiopsis sp. JB363]|nr:hypothetical protein BQ8420_24630 [Nocardiopsis sp. JB363]
MPWWVGEFCLMSPLPEWSVLSSPSTRVEPIGALGGFTVSSAGRGHR